MVHVKWMQLSEQAAAKEPSAERARQPGHGDWVHCFSQVNSIQLKETQEEKDKTTEGVVQDRQYQVPPMRAACCVLQPSMLLSVPLAIRVSMAIHTHTPGRQQACCTQRARLS